MAILTVAHWQIMMDAWPHWHPHGSTVTEIRLSSVSATDRPPTRGLPLPRPTWQTATARACVLATANPLSELDRQILEHQVPVTVVLAICVLEPHSVWRPWAFEPA
jgi:hypothetical protein